MLKTLLSLLCIAGGASAGYVGAEVCASCHAARAKQQSASEHARALRPPADHPLARLFLPLFRPGGVPAQWAFGAGDQAVTFVSRLNEDAYLEHRRTYYTRAAGLDLTPGHPARAKSAFPESAGVVYQTFDPEARIMRCFQCHSTGRLSLGPQMEIVPAEPGVRCEACHGPGQAHVEAMRAANPAAGRAAIQNPGRMSAAAQNQFCGECHRQPQQGETATNWRDPWNARHQPLYLAQSACFRRSGGRLKCLTCHDPHDALRRHDPDYYNGQCVSCHGGPHPAVAAAANARDCIACHMPAVSPIPHLQFANHWIGVYREGSPLQPVRR